MQDVAQLINLMELRAEQLQLHLRLVHVESGEARRIRALIATMQMRKRLLLQFAADESRAGNGTTVH